MNDRYIPLWLRHPPTPGVRGFAILAGLEASLRGMLVSLWPLVIYNSVGDARTVSLIYLGIGIASLFYGALVPWLNRFVARRWVYSGGVTLYLAGCMLALTGKPELAPLALLLTGWATVTVFICTNAYIMDFIARSDLGRSETAKMRYSALSWAVGPMLGVWLWKQWAPLPFLIALGFALALGATFWFLRLGNGKLITRARGPAPNPLAYLGRFLAQPRLITGWLIAVLRSVGWWVFVVYLPIFCIEAGLGDQIAAIAFSCANAMLFLSPVFLRWMQRRGLRRGVMLAFVGGGLSLGVAALGLYWPPLAVAGLIATAVFLVMLDTFGGLPFLMAVRPAERTEMSAVYSSFRDVSSVVTPALAWLVLLVAPIPGIFAATALAFGGMAALASRMHPRLGLVRPDLDEAA